MSPISFVFFPQATGQDQAHNVARQLTLLMPSIEIWLDVDHLVMTADRMRDPSSQPHCAVPTLQLLSLRSLG